MNQLFIRNILCVLDWFEYQIVKVRCHPLIRGRLYYMLKWWDKIFFPHCTWYLYETYIEKKKRPHHKGETIFFSMFNWIHDW